jgi:hypothetical protein
MAKTNTNWQTRDTKSLTTSILKQYGEKTSFSFSSSNQHQISNRHTNNQPGGTMMVVKNTWSALCTALRHMTKVAWAVGAPPPYLEKTTAKLPSSPSIEFVKGTSELKDHTPLPAIHGILATTST